MQYRGMSGHGMWNLRVKCQTERWRNALTDFSTGKMLETMVQAVRAFVLIKSLK